MKIIDIPIYGLQVLSFNSFKSLNSYCKNNNVNTKDLNKLLSGAAACAGILDYNEGDEGDLFICIDLPSTHNLEEALESVVHESLHCAYFILDIVGVHHDVNNHESITYLQQYIFAQYLKRYKVLDIKFDN